MDAPVNLKRNSLLCFGLMLSTQAASAQTNAPVPYLPTLPTMTAPAAPSGPSPYLQYAPPATTSQAAPAPDAPEAAPEEAPAEDKFFLQKLLETSPAGQTLASNGWKINGWTQGSYSTGSARRSNLPVPFIDRARDFSLNQNWLHIEKTIDTTKVERQIGGAVDLILPGTDYRLTLSRGLLTDQRDVRGNIYGFDLFQAYADVFLPNLGSQGTTVRAGKFATLIGYEVVQGLYNPFISRSYLFQYNPFTHTGAYAITPLNENLTMSNGIVLGNDNFFNDAMRPTYIGQLKWAPKDGKTTVAFSTTITDPTFDVNRNFAYYNAYNLLITHKFTDKFNYVADMTYSHMGNNPGVGFANWYGLANYFLYDMTDKIQTKLRAEVFNDAQGVRTGANGLYTAVTGGVTWKPTPWLYIMPEVRYDHNSGNSTPGPFEGRRDLFTATIGGIVRW